MTSTNLWIPLSHHICIACKYVKNLAHIPLDSTGRFSLLYNQKRGGQGHGR